MRGDPLLAHGQLLGAQLDRRRVALVAVPFMIVPLFFTDEMNILLQGEKRALELGVEVERTKRVLLVTAGVLTAHRRVGGGIIGFVGLVVPHIVRLLVGPEPPPAAARVAARRAPPCWAWPTCWRAPSCRPTRCPSGVVTTFVGAPLFVYLLRRGAGRVVTAAAARRAAAAPLVAVKDVAFAYDRAARAAPHRSTLEPGDFVGIVGPNGSGKSTLLDLIDGVLQPGAGEVLVKGRPTRQYRRRDMAREVALVPQHFALDFDLIGARGGRDGRLLPRAPSAGLPATPARRWRASASRELAERRFTELSGGEKQLVVLAQALMQQAQLAAARRAGLRASTSRTSFASSTCSRAERRRPHRALHPARPEPGAALLRPAAGAQRGPGGGLRPARGGADARGAGGGVRRARLRAPPRRPHLPDVLAAAARRAPRARAPGLRRRHRRRAHARAGGRRLRGVAPAC